MAATTSTTLVGPALLNTIHVFLIVSLGVVSGIALCLRLWVMPMVHQATATSTRIKQFNYIIQMGASYLMPFNRLGPPLLLSLVYITYNSSDPEIHARWKHYLTTILCLAAVGPYESILIFPINEKVAALGKELTKLEQDDFRDKRDQEVEELFRKWSQWHVGRIVSPTIATGILAASAAGVLPF